MLDDWCHHDRTDPWLAVGIAVEKVVEREKTLPCPDANGAKKVEAAAAEPATASQGTIAKRPRTVGEMVENVFFDFYRLPSS